MEESWSGFPIFLVLPRTFLSVVLQYMEKLSGRTSREKCQSCDSRQLGRDPYIHMSNPVWASIKQSLCSICSSQNWLWVQYSQPLTGMDKLDKHVVICSLACAACGWPLLLCDGFTNQTLDLKAVAASGSHEC